MSNFRLLDVFSRRGTATPMGAYDTSRLHLPLGCPDTAARQETVNLLSQRELIARIEKLETANAVLCEQFVLVFDQSVIDVVTRLGAHSSHGPYRTPSPWHVAGHSCACDYPTHTQPCPTPTTPVHGGHRPVHGARRVAAFLIGLQAGMSWRAVEPILPDWRLYAGALCSVLLLAGWVGWVGFVCAKFTGVLR